MERRRVVRVAVWTAVALGAATSWAVVALARGEQISAAWLIFAALGSYAIAYRYHARFIARKEFERRRMDERERTPRSRCC